MPAHRTAGAFALSLLIAASASLTRVAAQESAPSPVASTAANTRTAQLEAALRVALDASEVPGIAACIAHDGEILAQAAVGVRRFGDPTPVRVDDAWHLGSCTKSMTATLAAVLVERKLLRWDSSVAEVFAEEGTHEDFAAVTLAELLCHRSGLAANPTPLDYTVAAQSADDVGQRRRHVILRMLRRRPSFDPGTREVYSNAGYMVAGVMAQEVTGKSWEALMREELFAPLGMSSAGFGPPGDIDAESVVAPFGHQRVGDAIVPVFHDNPPEIGPAGTVHATLGDWAKYLIAHERGARGAPTLLEPASFDRLHTPLQGAYALGWLRARDGDDYSLWHNGSNTFWYAECRVRPRTRTVCLVALNLADRATSTELFAKLEQLAADWCQ